MCPYVLPAIALVADSRLGVERFILPDILCQTTVLLTPDGRQHLSVMDAGHTLQLSVTGTSLLQPVRLMTDAVLQSQRLRARFHALECLACINGRGRFPSRPHIEPYGRRLRVVLQALDGWLADAPYREIAVALFGEARVDADWTDPRDHLRDHVRRAVRRGRQLMRGGYRKLLL